MPGNEAVFALTDGLEHVRAGELVRRFQQFDGLQIAPHGVPALSGRCAAGPIITGKRAS